MRPIVVLLISFIVLFKSQAQEIVHLKTVPFEPETSTIYIEEVTDEREEQPLGLFKKANGNKVTLHLNKGAAQAVKNFYEASLLPVGKPIHIKIKALNVQESHRRMNKGIVKVARAHVELWFFEKNGNTITEVFRIQHNEDEVFGLAEKQRLQDTHEKRIRAALEYCMHAFLNNYTETTSKPLVNHFKPPTEGYNVDERLGQWFNLVTLKGMRSTNFEGYGVSYTGFVDSKKGLIKPYETSFEVTWTRPGVAEENGYKDVNSYVFRPELYFFYKRIVTGVYATASANIPIGYEIAEDLDGDNSFNFIIGAGASQGIRIMPWKRKGLVFGVDFFQQFETSKVFRTDFGLELVLGVNF
ncbi:hypothetical protein LV716_15900 [Flagellimonas sp. HMM57]|uniref:hypothetical protein n=1 Tax=unclassified Flagellimonas TaxID=2644544 RepID=UPI0013CFF49B|nr:MULTISPECIES: hypothetical protein [unclassified Flagellimonas]UII75724.1 hypothetical protein LV716_15900 [Flagellimonas sp. HMM57]